MKALILYGGWQGHTPHESAVAFSNLLIENGFQTTISDDMNILNDLEELRQYDLFVPHITMGKISDLQCKNLISAVADGAGIAGWHGGMCDSFRESAEWQFMTGAQWVAHPGNSKVTYLVKFKKFNKFTKGLKNLVITNEQYYMHVDPAVKVYATTTFPIADGHHSPNGKVKMPVVYTKKWGKGKVFYCSIGHTYKSLEIPQIKKLMTRGLLWAARSNKEN